MDKYSRLSYCGIDCGKCKNFMQNANCAGCRNETELVSDCPNRTCAIERDLLHCGECESYPCDMLVEFYEGTELRKQGQRNMQEILEIGVEEWLKNLR
jgi:hypothetical protein